MNGSLMSQVESNTITSEGYEIFYFRDIESG